MASRCLNPQGKRILYPDSRSCAYAGNRTESKIPSKNIHTISQRHQTTGSATRRLDARSRHRHVDDPCRCCHHDAQAEQNLA